MLHQIYSSKDFCFISTEKMAEIRQWLVDPSKLEDLIVSASVIAGFEWPSVLIMTSHDYDAQFYVRNMVMRAMWRLVWLKTDIFDSIYEGYESPLAIGDVSLFPYLLCRIFFNSTQFKIEACSKCFGFTYQNLKCCKPHEKTK